MQNLKQTATVDTENNVLLDNQNDIIGINNQFIKEKFSEHDINIRVKKILIKIYKDEINSHNNLMLFITVDNMKYVEYKQLYDDIFNTEIMNNDIMNQSPINEVIRFKKSNNILLENFESIEKLNKSTTKIEVSEFTIDAIKIVLSIPNFTHPIDRKNRFIVVDEITRQNQVKKMFENENKLIAIYIGKIVAVFGANIYLDITDSIKLGFIKRDSKLNKKVEFQNFSSEQIDSILWIYSVKNTYADSLNLDYFKIKHRLEGYATLNYALRFKILNNSIIDISPKDNSNEASLFRLLYDSIKALQILASAANPEYKLT